MSRRRYFEEQRSGNGAIYHCVEIDTDHDNRFEVLDLMSKDESDTISPDKVNNVLNQLRQGSCFLCICLIMYVKYNYMIYSKLLYIGGGVILSML